jgi:hypothetical protein
MLVTTLPGLTAAALSTASVAMTVAHGLIARRGTGASVSILLGLPVYGYMLAILGFGVLIGLVLAMTRPAAGGDAPVARDSHLTPA